MLKKNKKKRFIIFLVFLACLVCIIFAITFFLILYKSRIKDTPIEDQATQEPPEEEDTEDDIYASYPKLENLIDLRIADVKEQYPDGRDIESKTIWGSIYHSYEYETDHYILIVDAKDTGIIETTVLILKEFTDCKMDEDIINHVDEILPYAGFDPSEKGAVNSFGVSTGVATYYEYKEGFVLSISCYFKPPGVAYYQITYFRAEE